MGFTPDGSVIAVTCVTTNAIIFIDTKANKVIETVYVGRGPHEVMWTPDATEIWVSVRGQDFIQVSEIGGAGRMDGIEVKGGLDEI